MKASANDTTQGQPFSLITIVKHMVLIAAVFLTKFICSSIEGRGYVIRMVKYHSPADMERATNNVCSPMSGMNRRWWEVLKIQD